MRGEALYLLRILPVLVGVFMLGSEGVMAGQILTGKWTQQKSKDDGETSAQDYTYNLSLSQPLSEALSLEESLRYTKNRGADGTHTDTFYPSAALGLVNDIFSLDLQGNISKKRSSAATNTSNKSWDLNWGSTWNKKYWPKLQASYSESYNKDDEDPHRQNSESQRDSISVDWGIDKLRVLYQLNRSESDNLVALSTSETTSHLARFEGNTSLWQDRFAIALSHQYTENRDINTRQIGSGGFSLFSVNINQILAGEDDTPLITDDTELTDANAPLLTNGDTTTASGIFVDTSLTDPLSIAAKVNFETVDTLYLYTQDNDAAQSASFTFDLYQSQDGKNWQLARAGHPFVYDSTEKRFEFTVTPPLAPLWFKLVTSSSSATQVELTEIEVYRKQTVQSSIRSSFGNISDMNLGLKITPELSMTYNVTREWGEYASEQEFERTSQTASVKWTPWEYLTSSLNLSESRKEEGLAPGDMTRFYGINFGSNPLPTLGLNLGLTRNEEYTGDSRDSVKHGVGLFGTAQLYSTLDSSLGLDYSHNEDETSGLAKEEYNSNLEFTARLMPQLTSTLRGDYRQEKTVSSTENYLVDLSMNWRASETLSLTTTTRKSWENSESTGESLDLGINLSLSEKMQGSLTYGYNHDAVTTNTYSGFLDWRISRYVGMQWDAGYTQEDGAEESWQIKWQLTASFSTR